MKLKISYWEFRVYLIFLFLRKMILRKHRNEGYLDLCSAASTASPSSLGLVKVGVLPTHSPAPPFQTQLPHPWASEKRTPNTMLLEKMLAKPISPLVWG